MWKPDTVITGGTGFIGHWLRQTAPFAVYNMGHEGYCSLNAWTTGNWRYIIHLAPVPVDHVIQYAKWNNATVLLASSGGVYDRDLQDYFKMKLDDENKLLASGLDVKIARIFTTCGAHMQWQRYAIGNFIAQAAKGVPINVQSYGLVVRSYMYGSDLAEWLWKILLEGESGAIYNVGSDAPYSTQEIAFEVANHFVPRPQVNLVRKLDYEPRPFYVPDISRARDELGLEIKVPFEEAVRCTVEDYRNEH